MQRYVVHQGDCLSAIARRYGFADPDAIYQDPANADLRKLRPDKNVLYPGDIVVIPDPQKKTVDCGTGGSYKFHLKVVKKKLIIKLVDGEGKPMDCLPYVLVVGTKTYNGATDGSGQIQQDVDAAATTATLSLCGNPPSDVRIGSLNPSKDCDDGGVTGVQSRLHNLGYDPGPADGDPGPRTAAALRQFQCDNGIDPTGEPDDALLALLEQSHGV
jgi:hypothetical protein